MYAFVMYPSHQAAHSQVFLHETISEIAGFETDDLEQIIRDTYGSDYGLCDMNFLEIGEHKPITFEKHVSYTLYQE